MAKTDLVPAGDYSALKNMSDTLDMIRETVGGGDLSEFDLARVKMAAGGATFWQVPGLSGVESEKTIEGIVLFSKFSRSYWESAYDGSNDPPDCSSRDAQVAVPREGFQPPAGAIDQDGDGDTRYACNGCAFAEYGSMIREGKATRGQACKMSRQLFILTPQRRLPMVITLPPTSLKPAQAFFLQLADFGVDHRSITVSIGLEKKSGKGVPDYAVATFAKSDDLDDNQTAEIRQYADLMRSTFEKVSVDDRAEVGAV